MHTFAHKFCRFWFELRYSDLLRQSSASIAKHTNAGAYQYFYEKTTWPFDQLFVLGAQWHDLRCGVLILWKLHQTTWYISIEQKSKHKTNDPRSVKYKIGKIGLPVPSEFVLKKKTVAHQHENQSNSVKVQTLSTSTCMAWLGSPFIRVHCWQETNFGPYFIW